MMRKNLFLTLIVTATTVISFAIFNKNKRKTLLERLHDLKRSFQLRNKNHFPIEAAGEPISDNFENAKMVSEGSQYGVEYYNRVRQWCFFKSIIIK